MKNKRLISLFSVLVTLIVGGVIWGKPFWSKNENADKVAVTVFPIYDIVKNIAGDKVEVNLVLPPGASPHTFEPTPKELNEISGSKALFIVGHGLDAWAEKLSGGIGIDKTFTLDKNIDLLGSDEEEHGGFNPHYWLSVKNAILITDQVAEGLSITFPEYSADFKKNAFEYKNTLGVLDKEIESGLVSLPNSNIATFHDAWGYFARDYSIDIAAVFEEFPGKEPTAEYLDGFQNSIKENNIKVIFSEPQFSSRAIEAISKDLGVTLSTLDPLGGVWGRNSYESLMRYNLNQIVKALQ